MRILHTADWHAGRTLGRRQLDEGLKVALEQLVDYALSERVDAVLLAGDVFDQARPPHASQEMVYEALMRLGQAQVPLALVAGNHDSVGHWSALKPLLQLAGVEVVSAPSTRSRLKLNTRSGPLHVAALPWPTERLLSPLLASSDSDQLKVSWAHRVEQLVQVLCRDLPDDGPQVLLGHLMVNGSLTSCSERPLTIADTYAVPAQIFPPGLNYVALGHVHKPQPLASPVKAHYAGSLRPLDFGEAGQERGFYRVDLQRGRPTEVEFVALAPSQPLHQIEIRSSELGRLEEYRHQPGLYKVWVELEAPRPGLADEVRQRLPDAVIVQARLQSNQQAPELRPEKLLDPLQTFRTYHLSQYGVEPEAELSQLFLELLEEVDHASA